MYLTESINMKRRGLIREDINSSGSTVLSAPMDTLFDIVLISGSKCKVYWGNKNTKR